MAGASVYRRFTMYTDSCGKLWDTLPLLALHSFFLKPFQERYIMFPPQYRIVLLWLLFLVPCFLSGPRMQRFSYLIITICKLSIVYNKKVEVFEVLYY